MQQLQDGAIMQLDKARDIAYEIIDKLSNHFTQVAICGSIRRNKAEVNDIDIVAIQKATSNYEFGEPTLSQDIIKIDPMGHQEAEKLGKRNAISRFLDGPSIKRFHYKGIMIDLYLATKDNFECLRLIRTGSADHNKRLTILAMGKGWKLFASGQGLCEVKSDNRDEIVKVIDTTEDGILQKLLGRIPLPEARN